MYRSRRSQPRLRAMAATALSCVGIGGAASAAAYVEGADPTTTFSSLLLDDVTASMGGDSATATAFNPQRDLTITTGTGPQTVTIDGIGFNFRGGTATTDETVTVAITYLGADGSFGGAADNVLLGSRTATLRFGATNQYTAVFDTPIVADIDAVEDRFRFEISSTGNMRHKVWNPAQSPSGQNGLKISVGGSSVPVPEPASLALVGLGGLLMVSRRRA